MILKQTDKQTFANILFFSLPILVIIVLRFLNFDGAYGQDSYEYLRYTNAIEKYFYEGVKPSSFYWPVLYPLLGFVFKTLFGNAILSLQILSCFSLSLSCIYVLKTINLLFPKNQYDFLFVFLFGLLSPYFLKTGLVVMSDATAILFIVLSFYYFFQFKIKKRGLIFSLFFISCAVMTRFPSAIILFPIVIATLVLAFKEQKYKQLFISFLLAGIPLIPYFIFQEKSLLSATENPFLKSWSIENFFNSRYSSVDGFQNYLLPNLIFVLKIFYHPGFVFVGFILSFLYLKKKVFFKSYSSKIIITSIAIYLLFLAGIPFQNTRVLCLAFPLVLILLVPVFEHLIQFYKIKKKQLISFSIIIVFIQVILFILSFKATFNRSVFEKNLVEKMQLYQGNKLFAFDYDISLKGRDLDFNYQNMYIKLYTDFNKNDLVLFNPDDLAQQWKDKNPMKNWNKINNSYHLETLAIFDNNWKLYRIVSKK